MKLLVSALLALSMLGCDLVGELLGSEGGNAGNKLACDTEGWLDNEALTSAWGGGVYSALPASVSRNTAAGISVGTVYNVNLSPDVEEETDHLNVSVDVVESEGYKTGTHGGYLSVTPTETGVYRVAGTKAWQSFSSGEEKVNAKDYMTDCSKGDKTAVYQVVEFPLEKDKKYTLQLFRSEETTAKIYIHKAGN